LVVPPVEEVFANQLIQYVAYSMWYVALKGACGAFKFHREAIPYKTPYTIY
jgi:hypothetical protein